MKRKIQVFISTWKNPQLTTLSLIGNFINKYDGKEKKWGLHYHEKAGVPKLASLWVYHNLTTNYVGFFFKFMQRN